MSRRAVKDATAHLKVLQQAAAKATKKLASIKKAEAVDNAVHDILLKYSRNMPLSVLSSSDLALGNIIPDVVVRWDPQVHPEMIMEAATRLGLPRSSLREALMRAVSGEGWSRGTTTTTLRMKPGPKSKLRSFDVQLLSKVLERKRRAGHSMTFGEVRNKVSGRHDVISTTLPLPTRTRTALSCSLCCRPSSIRCCVIHNCYCTLSLLV